jgi:hypothetical protein
MADTDYMGGPRHAPAPQIHSMSQADVGGTSAILNQAGRSRPRKGAVGMPSRAGALGGPLRLDTEDILKAAGLGRRAPDQKGIGEQMSDAAEPTQTVAKLPDGTFAHSRRNTYSDGVTSTQIGSGRNPLDDYPNLNHDSMPANVGELQQRLGVPDPFGNEA